MTDYSFAALSLLVSNDAMVSCRNTALVLRVPMGEGNAATKTLRVLLCADVTTHVVTLFERTRGIVAACFISHISIVEWTFLWTDFVAWF